MPGPLITLTTDFGADSPYVAAMKGVLYFVHPEARVIDLSHSLPPQGLLSAAFFLHEVVSYFPHGTIHVAVVDPGVGTDRGLLLVEAGGQRVLAPDNGLWTPAAAKLGLARVVRLENSAYWRPVVSNTFHGRDVLAPVAGQLARGLDPVRLGPVIDTWRTLELPPVREEGAWVHGQVLFVDRFGNLLTNIPGRYLEQAAEVEVAGQTCRCLARTYADVPPGALAVLESSGGWVEIAVNQGHAAARLGASVGEPVRLKRR